MNGVFWGLLCLLLCAPGLVRGPRPVARAALAFGLSEVVLMVPIWAPALLLGLQYNWAGKLLGTLFLLLISYGLRWVSPVEVGLVRAQPSSWRVVGAVVLGMAAWQFFDAFGARHHHPVPTAEALWFQLLVPGIAEELLFRGVLLGLLGRVFPRNLPFFGTRTSWGGVVSVLLFVLAHGIAFRGGPLQMVPQVHFTLGEVADKVLMGSLFLWVRERTGSCYAAMATHNLMNTCLTVGHALLR